MVKKVLGYFLIFNSVTVKTRGNYQLSIINYQLMKIIAILKNIFIEKNNILDSPPEFHLTNLNLISIFRIK
ncbi:hypothetical protein CYANOKiyG1_02650 [Okeania sp. KiyG1]|nr:hypothetical protein CYANOKiyG1_02650 [Okeania sp. KiyG1]